MGNFNKWNRDENHESDQLTVVLFVSRNKDNKTVPNYPSVLINEYPYEMVSIAEIELDPKAGTYTLTNIDGRFHNIIDQIIDDLNYLFYQGMN